MYIRMLVACISIQYIAGILCYTARRPCVPFRKNDIKKHRYIGKEHLCKVALIFTPRFIKINPTIYVVVI